ncbi:unnamed protein product [Hanseniaspora opuntiae]
MSGVIRQLDRDTVNKIAAGEIIISPINCIKELIENSIDAGATKIDLFIQNNGFKMIKIQDNGIGIEKSNFSASGIITNLSYCNESTQFKKTSISTNKMMVFFINNRLIDCEVLRKNIIQTYNAFLPKTASSPFVYLSLFIKPENVDVNVHPTKKEVYFINDEEICELICNKITSILQSQDVSRTFQDNTKLTQPFQPQSNLITDSFKYRSKTEEFVPHQGNLPTEYRNESKLVRVDASQSNLSFKPLRYTTLNTSSTGSVLSEDSVQSVSLNECQSLESVKNLKLEIDNLAYPELIKFFSNCKYVGIIDAEKRICAMQCDLGLYMLDYGSICNVMFYQLALRNIGAFGVYKISSSETVTVKKLLSKIEITEHEEVQGIISTLEDMKDMFNDYFGIEFESTDGDLVIADLNTILENVIFPILKSKIFLPTKDLLPDINEIATLPGLYKIFERC